MGVKRKKSGRNVLGLHDYQYRTGICRSLPDGLKRLYDEMFWARATLLMKVWIMRRYGALEAFGKVTGGRFSE